MVRFACDFPCPPTRCEAFDFGPLACIQFMMLFPALFADCALSDCRIRAIALRSFTRLASVRS